VEDKLLTFDWLRELGFPFDRSSGFVRLIENCSGELESMRRISFETPSVIVPLRYVVILAAKFISLIRLPSSSIKDGLDLIKSNEAWSWWRRRMTNLHYCHSAISSTSLFLSMHI
jgi:hypothetical protein